MTPVTRAAPDPQADGRPPRGGRPSPPTIKPPSIEDVAQAARVSTATVSRYLNTPDLVAPATAQRIASAVSALGYRPNRFAQGLMTRRSHVVGVLVPDIHGEFYSELLRGASAEARQRGYHLLVAGRDVGEEPAAALRAGPLGLIDGLVVMLTEPDQRLWDAAAATRVPIVALDADPGVSGVASVLIDNTTGTEEATRHLLSTTDAARCVFVGGPADNYDSRQRAEAFEGVLRRAGHALRPGQTAFGDYSPEWGRAWAAQWLKTGPARPAGILAANDEIALGVIDALQAAGLAVPRDARVVGFDDSRLASLLRPSLSSVRIPRAEVGAAAVAALIDRIEHPEASAATRSLPTRLVVRDSSRVP